MTCETGRVQKTLTGGETNEERSRPDTFQYCIECNEYILRSREHPHQLHESEESAQKAQRVEQSENDAPGTEEEEDDEPRQVGNWYTVRMDYNMTYSFRVAASTERQAKEKADEKRLEPGTSPVDGHHLHTEVDRHEEIYEDDEEAEEHDLRL